LRKVYGEIQDWISWEASKKIGTYFPFWLTIKGAAGTGRGFVINTIVSYLRQMFDNNDVVHVVVPTGMAAFNILGETLHRFTGLDYRNMKTYMMQKGLKNSHVKKYKAR
jgi:hypothetical protein